MAAFIMYIIIGVIPLVTTIVYGINQGHYSDLVIGYYLFTLLALFWSWFWTYTYYNSNS